MSSKPPRIAIALCLKDEEHTLPTLLGSLHVSEGGKSLVFDAVVAMVLYTSATIAFYLLGAAILHRLNVVPKSSEMILTLSRMFTETVGPGALYLFLGGSFCVLFSTIFVSVASNALMTVDFLSLFGVTNFRDNKARIPWFRVFVVIWTSAYILTFILFKSPVTMVIVGGIAQTLMLPVIAFTVVYLRHRHRGFLIRGALFLHEI